MQSLRKDSSMHNKPGSDPPRGEHSESGNERLPAGSIDSDFMQLWLISLSVLA